METPEPQKGHDSSSVGVTWKWIKTGMTAENEEAKK